MHVNKEYDYVEVCNDIPVERKVLCYDDCAIKANQNDQPIQVSYKSTPNNKYSDDGSRKPFDQCKPSQLDEDSERRCHAIEIKALNITILLFLLLCGYTVYALSKDCSTRLYSIERRDEYQLPMTTKEYGIEFYVISSTQFNENYPIGTQNRTIIENRIIKEYIELAWGYCDYEQRHNFRRPDIPTPVCDRLQSLGIPRTRFNNASTNSH